MRDKIGWGFIGAGSITKRFITGFDEVPDARLAAVASRGFDSAKAFANQHNAKAYKDAEQVIMDENVDVIYVATPHTLHMDNTLLALALGKPVLCEKPLAINAEQAKEMATKSREKGVYLMEAMWTRFFPAMYKVREWLDKELIGKVNLVTADFGFYTEENPSSRLFDPQLAGGSLLDVGVYTIAFASMVYKSKPNRISSVADMASTGVDAAMSCSLGYTGGGIASLMSAVNTNTPHEARIYGKKGYIAIPKFWSPQSSYLYLDGQLSEEFVHEHPAEGFQFEIQAVHNDLRAGRIENELMPLDESIAIAETMDEIKAKW